METLDPGSETGPGTPYTVMCNNLAEGPQTFVIFQTPGPEMASSAVPLAWSIMLVPPTKQLPIAWTFSYSFSWAKAKSLDPGDSYVPQQTLDATLSSDNAVTLTRTSGTDYKLIDQRDGMDGDLTIVQDDTIAFDQAAVAIGMSKLPAYAVMSQPNITLSFRPPASGTDAVYYIAVTEVIKPGDVLSDKLISSAQEFQFPINVNAMMATLQPDLSLSIAPMG